MSGSKVPAGVSALTTEQLRWRCEPGCLDFKTTADVEPLVGVVGQDTAIEALRFGLATGAPGQNIFVRGLSGTGRMTLLKRLLEEIRPACPETQDRCYVRNFEHPDRPRLLTLPRGRGRGLAKMMDEVADFVHRDLKKSLDAEPMQAGRAVIDAELKAAVEKATSPFEEELAKAGFALVQVNVGGAVQAAILPIIDGKPTPPDVYQGLKESGRITEEQQAETQKQIEAFLQEFSAVTRKVEALQEEFNEKRREVVKGQIKSVLTRVMAPVRKHFDQPDVLAFLDGIVEDLCLKRMDALEKGVDFSRLYRVNPIVENERGDSCPLVVESSPTLRNLLGWIDQRIGSSGAAHSDHMMIHAGSLLSANGGYLLIEARDLLTEPGAWKVLIRALRCGAVEIVPSEFAMPWTSVTLKPEPIELDVKVILLGDSGLYYGLDQLDPDFPDLFKVLADFDSEIERDEAGFAQYAGVLARVAEEEDLLPLDQTAVAELVEHGARIAGKAGKLTTRFGRLLDIARESAFVASETGDLVVTGENVREAVRRTRRRADLPARKFRDFMQSGTIEVNTTGSAVGQVNGLAVISAGPLTYGFPQRITATIAPGTAGVVNIERESDLSGAIHTKGFYILGGLLRELLRPENPLTFAASIAFEQSYGGIDGDSASGAEMCCLLSSLTEIPLRQDIAMTGAIDQKGNLMAVGAVTEKIEGFFDVCSGFGLSGTQGVIIPASTAGNIMLRHDVIEAAERGDFCVYPVSNIYDALSILTGKDAGRRNKSGNYPKGSVLALAVQRAQQYWASSRGSSACTD